MSKFEYTNIAGEKCRCSCTQYEECNTGCSLYRRITGKQTNADRIRAMTDEELATFLFNNVDCSDCTMHGGGCSIDCEKWMLSWLKSPAKQEADE